VPSALCGLALPAAAAPRGHVHHGVHHDSKAQSDTGSSASALAVRLAGKRLLAWQVQVNPAGAAAKKVVPPRHVNTPGAKRAAPGVSLAENPVYTGMSQVSPSYEMQRAARRLNTIAVLRTTSPEPARRLLIPVSAIAAPRLVAVPVVKAIDSSKAGPATVEAATTTAVPKTEIEKLAVAGPVVVKIAPVNAKTAPAKPVALPRLAIVPVAVKTTETPSTGRGPADLSARHKDRVLLAQLEADLNRSETRLTRATRELTEGQRQLTAFGDTLRSAMMEAGPDAKGLHPFVKVAQRYAGTPYVWGGESARGFDCSGFIIRVMRDLGYRALPHSAAEQFRYGLPIANALLKPGDLVFFANTYKPGISHVGIYLGRRRFIHAAGTGLGTIVSSLDTPKFRTKYAGARRLVTQ